MFADDDGLAVAPEEKHRVHDVQVLIHVFLSCKVEKDVIGLCIEDVNR